MTKDEAIEKIKKCLALSASSNEHEAEAGLRQAQALMQKFGVDEKDLLAAGVSESLAKAGTAQKPPNWEAHLASKIAEAFGCDVIFKPSFTANKWCFIGCGLSPEIAMYAFDVLFRQVKRQRAEHIKTKLKRCKTSTKTRRADLFCTGWVVSVTKTIREFAGSEEQTMQIQAYLEKKYATSIEKFEPKNRNQKNNLSDREYSDYAAGLANGRQAELNHGVNGGSTQALLS